jgi:hypothetical protein
MKLVKEYINEKFTEDSDPISDMEIGLFTKWSKLKPGDIIYNKDTIGVIQHITIHNSGTIEIRYAPFYNVKVNKDIAERSKEYINSHYSQSIYTRKATTWEKKFKILKPGEKLYEYINEKFTEDSDPIKDMGIGVFNKRDFASLRKSWKFMYDIAPYLVGIKDQKELLDVSAAHYINENHYETLSDYYLEYITVKGSSHGLWADSFADFIKEKKRIGDHSKYGNTMDSDNYRYRKGLRKNL